MSDMSMVPSSILSSLGISPPHVDNVPAAVETPVDTGVDADFVLARDNILKVIDGLYTSIEQLSMIASQGQAPRAFEVLSNMYGQLMKAQHDLLDLRKKKTDQGGKQPDGPSTVEHHQHIHVGTTSDLQILIDQQMKKNGN